MDKDQLEYTFVEIGGSLFELIGWRKGVGQLYMLLYISEQPLSLDDIGERLNMSRSTVWLIVQKLQRLGAINKVWLREKRKAYYVAEKDLAVIFKNGVIPEINSKLLFFGNYLEQAEKALTNTCTKADNEKTIERYQGVIDEMSKMKEKIGSLLCLLAPGE